MNLQKMINRIVRYTENLRLRKDVDIEKYLKFYNVVIEYKPNNKYDQGKLRGTMEDFEYYLDRYDKNPIKRILDKL